MISIIFSIWLENVRKIFRILFWQIFRILFWQKFGQSDFIVFCDQIFSLYQIFIVSTSQCHCIEFHDQNRIQFYENMGMKNCVKGIITEHVYCAGVAYSCRLKIAHKSRTFSFAPEIFSSAPRIFYHLFFRDFNHSFPREEWRVLDEWKRTLWMIEWFVLWTHFQLHSFDPIEGKILA